MKVKELKEFLKDIDDNVEVFSYQEKNCEGMCQYDLIKKDNLFLEKDAKVLFL